MPQKVWDIVEQRLAVLQEPEWSRRSVREVCDRHGISPDTFYAWKRRYDAQGLEGLVPVSRRPQRSPRQLDPAVEDRILKLRKDHGWGPRKIRHGLALEGLDPLPAVSTVQQALARRGVLALRPKRSRLEQGGQRFERAAANELWQIDGAMHHLAGGSPYWVVDIIDDHSRYCIAARVGPSLTGWLAWQTFRAAASGVGLPGQLLSDNGLCFTGRLHGGVIVAFERLVRAAGTQVIHSRPYHPQTCGKIERLHRTARDWLARRDPPRTLGEAQQLFDAFREHYNSQRPHEALHGRPPASVFISGAPVDLSGVDIDPADGYPLGCAMRKVSGSATFTYRYHHYRLGDRWAGTTIGIVPDGAQLHVYYGASLIETFLTPTMNNR